jgi:hypothetical protein
MWRFCTHIINVQIMTNNVELHSIINYKHEMDLKLYALTFKVGKWFIRHLKRNIQIYFHYKSKFMIFVEMEFGKYIFDFTLFFWNMPYYDIQCHMWNEINNVYITLQCKTNLNVHPFNVNKLTLQIQCH